LILVVKLTPFPHYKLQEMHYLALVILTALIHVLILGGITDIPQPQTLIILGGSMTRLAFFIQLQML
ncbi:MAG TPA: hypothetical protein DCL77_06850, partial [Prolixibacteraceae bacterium]|nr:hypothetical protein [Prolixibacteraceae bacterium]